MLVIIVLIILLFLLTRGGVSPAERLYELGYFVDDAKFRIYNYDRVGDIDLEKFNITLPFNANIPRFRRIGSIGGVYYYTRQHRNKRDDHKIFDNFKFHDVLTNSRSQWDRTSSRLMAIKYQKPLGELPYEFNGKWETASDIVRVRISFGDFSYFFNIIIFGGRFYICGSRYGRFMYRLIVSTTNIIDFLEDMRSVQRFENVFEFKTYASGRALIIIYPFTQPEPEIYILHKHMGKLGEFFEKRLREAKLYEKYLELKNMPRAEFEKNIQTDTYGDIIVAYNSCKGSTKFCKNPRILELSDEIPHGFERRQIYNDNDFSRKFRNALLSIFKDPLATNTTVYKRNSRLSITIPAKFALTKNKARQNSVQTIEDLIEHYKNHDLGDCLRYIYEKCPESKNYYVQISLNKSKGLHSHFDGKKTGKLLTLNVGPSIYYDLYPVLMPEGQPLLRTRINDGEMCEFMSDARFRWAHAVPNFICFNYNRFVIVFREVVDEKATQCTGAQPGYACIPPDLEKKDHYIYDLGIAEMPPQTDRCVIPRHTLNYVFDARIVAKILGDTPTARDIVARSNYLYQMELRKHLSKLNIKFEPLEEPPAVEIDYDAIKKAISENKGYYANQLTAAFDFYANKMTAAPALNKNIPPVPEFSFINENYGKISKTIFVHDWRGTKFEKLDKKTLFTFSSALLVVDFYTDRVLRVILRGGIKLLVEAGVYWCIPRYACISGTLSLYE